MSRSKSSRGRESRVGYFKSRIQDLTRTPKEQTQERTRKRADPISQETSQWECTRHMPVQTHCRACARASALYLGLHPILERETHKDHALSILPLGERTRRCGPADTNHSFLRPIDAKISSTKCSAINSACALLFSNRTRPSYTSKCLGPLKTKVNTIKK